MTAIQSQRVPQTESPSGTRRVGTLRRWATRPEMAAVGGCIVVFIIFAITAGDNGFVSQAAAPRAYLEVAAHIGIVGVPVALLMIAGEFDLSVGSMVGCRSMIIAITVEQYGWPLWAGIAAALAVAALVGLFNGWVVVTTGLPSFIVTLGMLFALSGATIGLSRLLTSRTQVSLTAPAALWTVCSTTSSPASSATSPPRSSWWFGLVAVAHLRAAGHGVRELDLRLRRRRRGGAQRRRAGRPHEDDPLRLHVRCRRRCWPPSRCSTLAPPTCCAAACSSCRPSPRR